MLKKFVDGIEVILSDQEEAWERKRWALAEEYPDYHGAIHYDGASEPYILLEEAKRLHSLLVRTVSLEKRLEIQEAFEKAQEDQDSDGIRTALEARRALKELTGYDLSGSNCVDDLRAHMKALKAFQVPKEETASGV